ncbi:MAG: hypothetical protein MNSN_07130 [Minisyncoccus archaeiphilus]|uniref:LamG-like jellyroll fold domain-containing protein n=1 Tax=Minisyncoccus archaeiphilus TaxID=3238481 RepID=UPI002B1B4167|nr:MAG: hypothetical protein MNSN_07130 [Candidatus Parcubacteria bacterium]
MSSLYQKTPTMCRSFGTAPHVAISKNGSSLYCYKDGVLQGTSPFTGYSVVSSKVLRIGNTINTGYGQDLNAYLDEIRISKGVARWASDFTPPNAQYYWWNWGCDGIDGGTNITCGANKY